MNIYLKSGRAELSVCALYQKAFSYYYVKRYGAEYAAVRGVIAVVAHTEYSAVLYGYIQIVIVAHRLVYIRLVKLFSV